MIQKEGRRQRFLTAIFALILLAWGAVAEGKVITDIKATHSARGVQRILLKKVGELNADSDYTDFFLVKPCNIAAGRNGEIFIHDLSFSHVFHLDSALKLVRKIGRAGIGPGELHPRTANLNMLYVTHDHKLLLSDNRNGKLMWFDYSGKLLNEQPVHQELRHLAFRAAEDMRGNIYTVSVHGGGVDQWTPDGKFKKTFLDKSAYEDFLLYEPPDRNLFHEFKHFSGRWTRSTDANTSFDFFDNHHFVILTANSVTLYVFRNEKPILKKNIWIEEEFPLFEKHINELKVFNESNKSVAASYSWMVRGFVKDCDDNRTFYVCGLRNSDNKVPLYHFDLQGRLLDVFYADCPFTLKYKRNNRFYGYKMGGVSVYERDRTLGRRSS